MTRGASSVDARTSVLVEENAEIISKQCLFVGSVGKPKIRCRFWISQCFVLMAHDCVEMIVNHCRHLVADYAKGKWQPDRVCHLEHGVEPCDRARPEPLLFI